MKTFSLDFDDRLFDYARLVAIHYTTVNMDETTIRYVSTANIMNNTRGEKTVPEERLHGCISNSSKWAKVARTCHLQREKRNYRSANEA